jgi:hypothetical protein
MPIIEKNKYRQGNEAKTGRLYRHIAGPSKSSLKFNTRYSSKTKQFLYSCPLPKPSRFSCCHPKSGPSWPKSPE